jgi:hypothetical protein
MGTARHIRNPPCPEPGGVGKDVYTMMVLADFGEGLYVITLIPATGWHD